MTSTLHRPVIDAADIVAWFGDTLRGPRPSQAELLASALCADWYISAPPLQPAPRGMASHPAGEWPNVPPLKQLELQLDRIEDVSAALALTRALHAMFPWPEEVADVAASVECRLLERGATAPDWSLQLDAWRLTGAWDVCVHDRGDEFGQELMHLLWFEHPCGDAHGLCLSVDPHNFSHLHEICGFDEREAFVDDVRREIEAASDPAVTLRESDLDSIGYLVHRSVKKTYLHEFEPLRRDPESIGAFALARGRANILPVPLQ